MSSNLSSLMGRPDFYGPRLKLERAEHHIDKLEAILRQYVRDNMKRLRAKDKRRALKEAQPTGALPRHTPTVLGDALHNLRVALDHAYYIACEANQAALGEFTRFPFGKDRQSLEGSINGQKEKRRTPSDKVVGGIVNDIQPYESGRLGLYGLHRLDITDKHKVLIPTKRLMVIKRLDFIDGSGAKTGGGIRNLTIATDERHDGFAQMIPSLSGSVIKGDPKDTFIVSFGDGEPFEGQSILETVLSLKKATVEALNIIAEAI